MAPGLACREAGRQRRGPVLGVSGRLAVAPGPDAEGLDAGSAGSGAASPELHGPGLAGPEMDALCVCVEGELLQALRGGHRMGQRARDW